MVGKNFIHHGEDYDLSVNGTKAYPYMGFYFKNALVHIATYFNKDKAREYLDLWASTDLNPEQVVEKINKDGK